jgi:hypothetical protein
MAAEAFASPDSARIFAFIFLRSRTTRERLPRASARLPPDLCWIDKIIPKKFASGTGIFSYNFAQASPNGIPTACVSRILRNSDFTGSGDSTAITFKQSSSGSPALAPRTMTSIASGNASTKRASRRFFKSDSSHRGKPKAPTKASIAATMRPAPLSRPARNRATLAPAETSSNCRFDHVRPACEMRAESGICLLFLLRSSNSLSVASMSSRRDFWWPRVVRAGSAWVTLATRCLALRSPDKIG